MAQKNLAELRNVLIKLFQDKDDIRRIIDDSGIDSKHVNFNTSNVNVWQSVLVEADKKKQVAKLVEVVKVDYPESNELQAAYDNYRQSTSQTGQNNDQAPLLPTGVTENGKGRSKGNNEKTQRFITVIVVIVVILLLAYSLMILLSRRLDSLSLNLAPTAQLEYIAELNNARVYFVFTHHTGESMKIPDGGTLKVMPGGAFIFTASVTLDDSSLPHEFTHQYFAITGSIPPEHTSPTASYVAPIQPGPDIISVLITDSRGSFQILRSVNVIVQE